MGRYKMHSVLFVCALLVLMVSNSITIPEQEGKIRLACPLEGIDFLGYDLNGGGGLVTSSWEECGNMCKVFKRCKFWSWVNKGDAHHNECWLKTSDVGIELEVGIISGDKRCPN